MVFINPRSDNHFFWVDKSSCQPLSKVINCIIIKYIIINDLPLGDSVIDGIECIEGSAMYLKSTGIPLKLYHIQIIAL
jgi:hypothetical protein